MKFNEKMLCSTLKDEQHRKIIDRIDCTMDAAWDIEDLVRKKTECRDMISHLLWVDFICPNESRRYKAYIEDRYENKLEHMSIQPSKDLSDYDPEVWF